MAKKSVDSAPQIAEPKYYPPSAHLNSEHMKKMGIKGPPALGDKIPMHGRVTSVSESEDGGHSVSVELQKMAEEASKPAHANDHEGKLRGAKAAMDIALDKQEGEKPRSRRKSGSTGAPGLNPEGAGEED